MAKHITPISRPGNPPLIIPEDTRPARTHAGLVPSTGIKGRGMLVSPQNMEARGEGETPKGTNRDKTPSQKSRVKVTGPAEHVLP